MSAKQHDEYVADEFDRAAAGYDDSCIVRSYQRRVQALVVERLDLVPGMNVLDLGCGTGWATFEIASRLLGSGRVVGLDLSEGMIGQARKKLQIFQYRSATGARDAAWRPAAGGAGQWPGVGFRGPGSHLRRSAETPRVGGTTVSGLP
jgi:cyclopropane fatty-acyl-phospholipid synthase-like methyltransferase